MIKDFSTSFYQDTFYCMFSYFKVANINKFKFSGKCANFQSVSSSLISKGIYKVTFENCNYLQFGNFFTGKLFGT